MPFWAVFALACVVMGASSIPLAHAGEGADPDQGDSGLLLTLQAGNPMGAGFGVGYGFEERRRALVEVSTLFGIVFHLGVHYQTPIIELGRAHIYVGASGGLTYTHGCSWGGCGPMAYGVGAGPHLGTEVALVRSFALSVDGGVLGGRWHEFQGNRGIWRYMIPQVVVRGAYRW